MFSMRNLDQDKAVQTEATQSTQPAQPTEPAQPTQPTKQEERSARVAVVAFPVFMLVGFAVGMLFPDQIAPTAQWVPLALGVVMFGMGLTLTVPDFSLVVKRPVPVLIGVVAQFVIMPLLAITLAWVFRLPPEIAVGLVLVGCAPGGTSSNVIAYLAKGDVALSVTMTSISTLLAPIFTPILTLWLAGAYLPISASSMAVSIVQMVLLPVIGGLVIRLVANNLVTKMLPILPWISTLGIAIVLTAVVANSADKMFKAGIVIIFAVIIHNLAGYALGYATAKGFGQPEQAARTTAVEVGMQNSGLAATLASQNFDPVAAIPAALFSVWHGISGGLLAMYFRHKGE